MPNIMQRYTKILVEKYRLNFEDIRKNSLYPMLLIEISIRARRSDDVSLEGLEQGEFFLSEMEYDKFWLKKAQKWQIRTAIKKFILAWFIAKVTKKRGSKGWTVYKVLDWCPFQPSFQNREQNREIKKKWKRTNREEISKVSKNEIKEMDFDSLVQAYTPDKHDLFIECHWPEEAERVKESRFKLLK